MPKAQEIQTYDFQELEGKAKQRAVDWLAELVSEDIVDRVSDLFQTELSQRGLDTLKAHWSLNHVQGDGVWFSGMVDLATIEAIQGEEGHGDQQADEGNIEAIRKAADGHELSVSVRFEDYRSRMEATVEHLCYGDCDANRAEAAELNTRDAVEEWLKDLAYRFARMGYAEADYVEEEDYLAEIAEANEYLFDKEGRPIHHLL